MKYTKGSVEYLVNVETLREMEEVVPMTTIERRLIRGWVRNGHDVDSNPWHYLENSNTEMNYLKARRIIYGMSHGPWDDWEYDSPFFRPGQLDCI